MARIKTNALQQIDQDAPEVLSADIFSAELANIFKVFDLQQPLIIISEGLINYFDQKCCLPYSKALPNMVKALVKCIISVIFILNQSKINWQALSGLVAVC